MHTVDSFAPEAGDLPGGEIGTGVFHRFVVVSAAGEDFFKVVRHGAARYLYDAPNLLGLEDRHDSGEDRSAEPSRAAPVAKLEKKLVVEKKLGDEEAHSCAFLAQHHVNVVREIRALHVFFRVRRAAEAEIF
jgi:hypothetical protein